MFNGISTFLGYLIPKPSFWKNSNDTIQPISGREAVHAFPEDIGPKVNKMARLESELAYYRVAVQQVSHDTMRTSHEDTLCQKIVLNQRMDMLRHQCIFVT